MRRPLIILAFATAGTAHADTTAVYANAAICSMTVKIASNGDMRGEISGNFLGMPGQTFYFVGGKGYLVDEMKGGEVVMRLEDIGQVMAEDAAKMGLPSSTPPPLTLLRKGTVSIKRWSGDAYYMQNGNDAVSPRPVAVISHDPSLAQLGKAMERQFAMSEMMMSRVMNGHVPKSNMDQVLSSGAPISFAGAELQSVSFDPIPKSEFALPSQPMPIDQIRKRMNTTPGRLSVTTKTGRKPDIPCHIVARG